VLWVYSFIEIPVVVLNVLPADVAVKQGYG
jgi:hypothetical protein